MQNKVYPRTVNYGKETQMKSQCSNMWEDATVTH